MMSTSPRERYSGGRNDVTNPSKYTYLLQLAGPEELDCIDQSNGSPSAGILTHV